LQLPTFTKDDVVALRKKDPETTFYKFCKQDEKDRAKIMNECFPKETKKLDQVEKCINALPLLDVNIEAGTLGCDEVCVNDLLNVKI
jgi:hypothetical protein